MRFELDQENDVLDKVRDFQLFQLMNLSCIHPPLNPSPCPTKLSPPIDLDEVTASIGSFSATRRSTPPRDSRFLERRVQMKDRDNLTNTPVRIALMLYNDR